MSSHWEKKLSKLPTIFFFLLKNLYKFNLSFIKRFNVNSRTDIIKTIFSKTLIDTRTRKNSCHNYKIM